MGAQKTQPAQRRVLTPPQMERRIEQIKRSLAGPGALYPGSLSK